MNDADVTMMLAHKLMQAQDGFWNTLGFMGKVTTIFIQPPPGKGCTKGSNANDLKSRYRINGKTSYYSAQMTYGQLFITVFFVHSVWMRSIFMYMPYSANFSIVFSSKNIPGRLSTQ